MIRADMSMTVKATVTSPFSGATEPYAFAIVLTGGGANMTRTFSLSGVVPTNPDDVPYSTGSVFKSLEMLVLGTDANPPMTTSAT